MDRLACANLPAFPLQLLLKRHPEWAACPAAVVAKDKPQGLILWVNEKARQAGVLPGFRYAAGLALAAGLRAGEVSPVDIENATASLTARLMGFTPDVEPSANEPGVFWLNVTGMNLLYPSLKKWAHAVHADIEAQGFRANVVAGFTRFGTYAAAKAGRGVVIFREPSAERTAAARVPLDRLDLEPRFRDALSKLGIRTVGALLALPAGGLYERFGAQAYRIHRMASGELWAPLAPCKPEAPVKQTRFLDEPESDVTRLLFLIKQLIHPMIATLVARSQALATLWISFLMERPYKNLPLSGNAPRSVHGELRRTMNGVFTSSADRNRCFKEQIRPAAPTLDAAQILDLVRLRLESIRFPAGVVEVELTAEGCEATREQLRLFTERSLLSGACPELGRRIEGPARDLDAANRALARLRAEFGDGAVVRAKLTDGHLPEARFTWEPLRCVALPRNDLNGLSGLNVSNGPTAKVLVRRILAKPMSLPAGPHRSTHEDGWLILGPKYGAVDKLSGPYVFSGGWWNREIQRDYYFAETRRGDILWVYYDRVRRRWFLQGAVE